MQLPGCPLLQHCLHTPAIPLQHKAQAHLEAEVVEGVGLIGQLAPAGGGVGKAGAEQHALKLLQVALNVGLLVLQLTAQIWAQTRGPADIRSCPQAGTW